MSQGRQMIDWRRHSIDIYVDEMPKNKVFRRPPETPRFWTFFRHNVEKCRHLLKLLLLIRHFLLKKSTLTGRFPSVIFLDIVSTLCRHCVGIAVYSVDIRHHYVDIRRHCVDMLCHRVDSAVHNVDIDRHISFFDRPDTSGVHGGCCGAPRRDVVVCCLLFVV